MKNKCKSKRLKKFSNLVNTKKSFSFSEIFDIFNKKYDKTNFDESIDISISLNINKIQKKNINGYLFFPYPFSKKKKIAIISDEKNIKLNNFSNIFYTDSEKILQKIKKKIIEFDFLICDKSSMVKIKSLSYILGPKKLMPSYKNGTITSNFNESIKKINQGKIFYNSDKNGIIRTKIGKMSFNKKKIILNLQFFLKSLNKLLEFKGKNFLKKIFISSTMSKSLKVDIKSIKIFN